MYSNHQQKQQKLNQCISFKMLKAKDQRKNLEGNRRKNYLTFGGAEIRIVCGFCSGAVTD